MPSNRWELWSRTAVGVGFTYIAISLLVMTRSGYPPIGDWGVFLVRSLDVGTRNTPLLGTRSSVSRGASDVIMHHPGPIEFYLAAPWVRAFGERGLAVAGAVNHVLWFGASVWLVGRTFGSRARFAIAVAGLTLLSSMGMEELVSVWPPTAILFPLIVTMAAAAVLVRGDSIGWLPMVLGFTLVAQSSLAAAPIATVVVVGAVAASVYFRLVSKSSERRWADPLDSKRDVRRAAWAAAIGAVLWMPPVIEQLTDAHPNMTAILRGASNDGPTYGLSRAITAVSGLVGSPLGWAGDRYQRPWLPDASLGFGQALPTVPWVVLIAGLVMTIGLAVVTSILDRRRNPDGGGVRRQYAMVAGWITVAVLVVARAPFEHQILSLGWLRWLWALAVVVSAVTIWNLAVLGRQVVEARRLTGRRKRIVTTLAPPLLVLAACTPMVTAFGTSHAAQERMSATRRSVDNIEAGVERVLARDRPKELVLSLDIAGSSITGLMVAWLGERGIHTHVEILGDPEVVRGLAVFGDERRQQPLSAAERQRLPELALLWLRPEATLEDIPLSEVVACGPLSVQRCRRLIELNRLDRRTPSEEEERHALLGLASKNGGVQVVATYRPATES